MNNTKIYIIIGCADLCLILGCLALVIGFGGILIFQSSSNTQVQTPVITMAAMPTRSLSITPQVQKVVPTSTLSPILEVTAIPTETLASEELSEEPPDTDSTPAIPFQPVDKETLEILEDVVVPINDLRDLAQRLNGIQDIPLTVSPPDPPYQAGDTREFWVTNLDINENFTVEAVLEYVTEHAYFWIEDGVSFRQTDLEELADAFENKIYPTNRAFFGSEWFPGVDGDPRLYILLARGLGYNLAGYYSSADEYHPLAHEYSNTVELFLLNADNIELDSPFTYGVLAHEFQHMIHWNQDRNESSWLNEGFSELAAFLNGYYESGFDWLYIRDPDLQLNDWPNDPGAKTPHYGASFLFLTYFLDRFGEDATRALVANPENGLTSVDSVLQDLSLNDPLTGEQIRAEHVFLDWVTTNILRDTSIGDGRFDYRSYQDAAHPEVTESFSVCPVNGYKGSVKQFGVDYLQFTCPGSYELAFQGESQVGVLPEDAYSGEKAFWSNNGDESDMILTRQFDFRDHAGDLTLSYWTWYDLETDYDYLYLLASLDGMSWEILKTPSGIDLDPSGNSYGWSYNGISGGGDEPRWIQETVDLSQFAGEQVWLRFEYVTDAAVNGEGFLLDEVEIPQIDYFADFEVDDGGWDAEGWVRIRNVLPQTYRLALIRYGIQTTVEYLNLTEEQSLETQITIGGENEKVILVVTGTARFTRQEAGYTISLIP